MAATPMICQTCNRVVDSYVDEDGAGFMHTEQDADDHPVVPAPMPEGYTGGRCDFCSADNPTYVLPAKDFRVPATDTMSGGDWSTCTPCADLIRAKRWSAVYRRAVLAWERTAHMPMDPEAKRNLRAMYDRLQVHITGPLRPIERPAP